MGFPCQILEFFKHNEREICKISMQLEDFRLKPSLLSDLAVYKNSNDSMLGKLPLDFWRENFKKILSKQKKKPKNTDKRNFFTKSTGQTDDDHFRSFDSDFQSSEEKEGTDLFKSYYNTRRGKLIL